MLQEHALRPDMGDLMTDIFYSPKWKAAYATDGLFQGDPRGLSMQLSTDGVNPFSANKICYSMWPIMLSVLNWSFPNAVTKTSFTFGTTDSKTILDLLFSHT